MLKRHLSLFMILCLGLQLGGCSAFYPEGAETLIAMQKEEKVKDMLLVQDEMSFQKIRQAIMANELERDSLDSKVADRFGPPAVVVAKPPNKKWVYQGAGGWFTKPKIYLYFNGDSHLTQWVCVRHACDNDS